MAYKYGVYGQIGADIIQGVEKASVVAVYIGTAPVHLLADYKGKVNTPIRISNINEARALLGAQFSSSDKWGKYTLCEAVEAHFNNRIGNVGPIYVINVLDPATMQGEQEEVELTFANRRATIVADDIIVSTLVLTGKTLGTDYTLTYNDTTGTLTITDIGGTPMTTIQATYTPVDTDGVDADVIIGGKDSSGNETGIAAIAKVYRNYNAVPTYIAAPTWSETPSVYEALCSASQLINDHWFAFVFADIPVSAADTIDEAIAWKATNDYTSGVSKVFWPKVQDNGTIYHISTLALAEKMRVDIANDNIPYEQCANKPIPATALYISASSPVVGYDRPDANKLCAAGITTGIFWEGDWRVWGDHTAAFVDGGSYQAREIFDTNIIMLNYIVNSFQREWGNTIDEPMTVALRDTILNREQEKLDALVSVGALIGAPTVELVDTASAEGTDVLLAGFEWQIATTVTPPLKSATVTVSYTNAGYAVLYGDEAAEEISNA